MTSPLRAIPSVDRVLRELGEVGLPRPLVVAVVRRELDELRQAGDVPAAESILRRISDRLDELALSRLRPIVNGAGVIIHTNFGRTPLASSAVDAVAAIATGYCNLEFDLGAGVRGGRAGYVELGLASLCGAEAATVVNNCAAALVLVLRHLCKPGRAEVVISRGELVQIGGGFRIPEVLDSAGAILREVGTTNQTTAVDYARAIGPATALVLKVHRGNFYMEGFVKSPTTAEIAAVVAESATKAGGARPTFVEDVGSGAMPGALAASVDPAAPSAVEREPTPADALAHGADLVCFSGDKLLGGPQAGVIAGPAAIVSALKTEPFFRALRCDKLVLAALQATIELHLAGAGAGPAELPVVQMMRTPTESLRQRAEALVSAIVDADLPLRVSIGPAETAIGGGALPRTTLPSVALALVPTGMKPAELSRRLRTLPPPLTPVIGRFSDDAYRLDLRTIFPAQDALVLAALRAALVGGKSPAVI